MIKTTLKKSLSLILAMVMVFSMIPASVMNVFAADYVLGDTYTTDGNKELPAAPAGTAWVQTNEEILCGLEEHTHEAGDSILSIGACYYPNCDHADGHLSSCYSSSTAYAVCPDKDNHAHTNTANLTDVVTINGTNVSWVTTHPAYSAVYAIYKEAYDKAYNDASFLKDVAGKAAGVLAVADVTVCYTTTSGSVADQCTHTCTSTGCALNADGTCASTVVTCTKCFKWNCTKEKHAHVAACYKYTYTLMDARAVSVIADKDDEAVYYSALTVDEVKANIFNAIYDPDNSNPNNLTVADVTVEVYITLPDSIPDVILGTLNVERSGWYDITTSVAGVSIFSIIQGLAGSGSIQARLNYAGNTTMTAAVSDGATVTLVDNRSEAVITLSQTAFTAPTEDDFEDAVKAAVLVNGEAYEWTLLLDTISLEKQADETYTATIKINGTNKPYVETTATITGITWNVTTYVVSWVVEGTTTTNNAAHGAAPVAPVAVPTKTSDAQYDYTFAGWKIEGAEGETVYFNADLANLTVTEAVTFVATFTSATRSYTIKWDIDGDHGDAKLVETTVEYGKVPEPPTHATIEGKTFAGWEPNRAAVTGEATYKAIFSDDTFYTVKFVVDGTEYAVQNVNATKNQTIVAPENNPDKADYIFTGWADNGMIGQVPTTDLVIEANWIEDANDNNVLDSDETISITINGGIASVIVSGESALVSGDDKYSIYDSTKNSYTIVIEPSEGRRIVSVTGLDITGGTWANGVLTVSGVAFTDGQEIVVNLEKYGIEVATNPTVKVNGYSKDTKLADFSKANILAAILGTTEFNADDYTVEMYVEFKIDVPELLQGLVGKTEIDLSNHYDIWDPALPSLGDTLDALAKTAFDAAVSAAIDTAIGNETEFKITKNATDKLPKASAVVDVNVVESRPAATVTHNGDSYVSSELNDVLLADIKADISYNATFSSIAWKDSSLTFVKGNTYDVTVVLTLVDNKNVYVVNNGVYEFTVKVTAPFDAATITVPGKDGTTTVKYNTGRTDVDKTAAVLDALKPDYTPAGGTGTVKVWYLASAKRNVEMEIDLKTVDLGSLNFVKDMLIEQLGNSVVTFQVPVEDMWVNIGTDLEIPAKPDNKRIAELAISILENIDLNQISSLVNDKNALKTLFTNALAKEENADIKAYYELLGAHYFGEFENEIVYVTVENYTKDDVDYGNLSTKTTPTTLTLVDDRADTAIKLNSGVSVVYGQYTEAQLMALILDGVYANGAKVDGLTVEFVTDVAGLPATDGVTVKVKFAGNKDYKPSEAEVTIAVNKAPVKVVIDNQVVKHGTSYNKLPVSTDPAGVETIKFIVGLDISDVNFEGTKIQGILGNVQLLIPAELQSMLSMLDGVLQNAGVNVSFADGASMKLSELKKAVDTIGPALEGTQYAEYFRVLIKMLESIPTDVADVEITVGGVLPSNIGAYLIGAVTANANYETAFNVGVLVITPNGIKTDIAWNEAMASVTMPQSLIASGAFDAYAKATGFTYGEAGDLDFATSQIVELFIGLGIDGSFVLETNAKNLNLGAYVEVAMIVNWGNTVYYSEPIARPFVVIADELNVEFVNPDRLVTFNNAPQNDIEKLVVVEKQTLNTVTDYEATYYYVGLQTNGKPYAETTAPTHAGAYTVTVVVKTADGKWGCAVGALVITPAEAEINVATKTEKYTGKPVDTSALVNVSTNIPAINPDKTVITAMINTDGTFLESGIVGIDGDLNIDLPAWVDEIIGQYASISDGISIGDFITVINKVESGLAKLNIKIEYFTTLKNFIAQLPNATLLTFKEQAEVAPSAPGLYLVVGIITDSDFIPAMNAGILVIYPDAKEAVITWNYADANNNGLLIRETFEGINLGATAEGTDLGVHTIFVGVNDEGKLVLNRVLAGSGENMNAIVSENGVYAQVAYITDLGSSFYYAEPQVRLLVVTSTLANVEIVDVNGNKNIVQEFTYDGQPHGVTVKVDGQTNVEGLKVMYIGSDTTVDGWYREEAPTDAGVYTVVAVYTKKDGNGKLLRAGSAIGVIVINPADTNVALEDNTVKHNGEEHFAGITNEILDYITIAINRDTNTIYVNIPADSKAHFERLVSMLPAELEAKINAFIEKYAGFDGDVQTSTVKAELASIINDLIAYEFTASKIAEAEQLADSLINELKANVDIQAAVAELKDELNALKSNIGSALPEEIKAEISDYLTAVLAAVESNVDIDVDALKTELKAKVEALEAYVPAAVVAELKAMIDEFIATVNANIDVATIEAKISQLAQALEIIDTEDVETLIKYVVGAAYGLVEQSDLTFVKSAIYKAATKIEAQGYVDYVKYMVNSIVKIYGSNPTINTTAVQAEIAEMIAKIEEKLASGEFDADDIYAVETYLDNILASLLDLVNQIPEGKIVFGSNPTEIGTYECYAINLSANYKSEVASATLVIAGELLGDVDLDGDVDSDDLTLLARHIAGIEILVKAEALINADVNRDMLINSDDLTKHARYVAGIITDWTQE